MQESNNSPFAVRSSKNVSNGDVRCFDGNADVTPVIS